MFGALPPSAVRKPSGNWVAQAYDKIKNRPIAKVGGDVYLVGDAELFILSAMGAHAQHWYQAVGQAIGQHWYHAVGGIGFFGVASVYSKAGDNPKWFATAAAISIPLMAATNYEGLASGSPWAWAGTSVYSAGMLIGAFSEPITKYFKEAKNALVRNTLGAPRRLMGALSAGSKIPMIFYAASKHQWGMVAVLGSWIVGDILVGISSARPSNQNTPQIPKSAVPA